jgi:hypothetical protein
MKLGFVWGIAVLVFLAVSSPLIMDSAAGLRPVYLIAAGVIVAALWVLVAPGLHRRIIDRRARKLYGEGQNKALVGINELESTVGGLESRGKFGQAVFSWNAVERIASNHEFTFIYLGALSAIVIPHHAIQEGNLNAFVEAINQNVTAAKANEAGKAGA